MLGATLQHKAFECLPTMLCQLGEVGMQLFRESNRCSGTVLVVRIGWFSWQKRISHES